MGVSARGAEGPYVVVCRSLAERWVVVALERDGNPALGVRWFHSTQGRPRSAGYRTSTVTDQFRLRRVAHSEAASLAPDPSGDVADSREPYSTDGTEPRRKKSASYGCQGSRIDRMERKEP